MSEPLELLEVNADNVEKMGFFCLKSKPKSAGYRRKLAWLQQRFAEGLRIKILGDGKRTFGFIEYIPGEYAWRAVHTPGYLVIHCLWVVGQGKGQGIGARLLDECVQDAQQAGRQGVVMIASGGNWLAGKQFFLKRGFTVVDSAPPAFDLLVQRFSEGSQPAFPHDWARRLTDCGPGLTLLTTDQCPYLAAAEEVVETVARERGIELHIRRLESSQAVQAHAVSPYGVYSLVYNGRLLTHHWEARSHLEHLLDETVVSQG